MDDKLLAWQRLLAENHVRPDEAAFIGDDLFDLPVLKRAGLAIAVADACAEARAVAHYVTDCAGGRGAVREVIELILRAQGRWADVIAKFA
jgi:3-deoxy-D-manno-octulosonate 8-phosphate phosphatase (KDO 8-P phosphatase)